MSEENRQFDGCVRRGLERRSVFANNGGLGKRSRSNPRFQRTERKILWAGRIGSIAIERLH